MKQVDGKIHGESIAINPAAELCPKSDDCPEYELTRHHCNESGGNLCVRKRLKAEPEAESV